METTDRALSAESVNRPVKTGAPWGVSFISAFYTFGAVILLALALLNPTPASAQIAERHGLLPTTGPWILFLVGGLALGIAYGLHTLSRWGYSLTMVYQIYFGIVSLGRFLTEPNVTDFANLAWSLFVIICLHAVRTRFATK